MAVVWVLEKPRPAQANLPDLLQGDFAVRAFASIRSFLRLCRHRVQRPDLLFIRCEDFTDELHNLDQILVLQWEGLTRVYWGQFAGTHGDVWVLPEDIWQEIPFLLQQILQSMRQEQRQTGVLQLGDLCLDLDGQRLRILPEENWLRVAPKEMQLLKLFVKNPDRCLSHEDLAQAVWRDIKVSTRSIASHISRLRRHLSSSSYGIRNVYGGGYQLSLQGEEELGP